MKVFAAIWLMALFFVGCVNSGHLQNKVSSSVVRGPCGDSFVVLQAKVKQKLGDLNCGPVTTNEVRGGRCFEVYSKCRILVSERKFFTQPEWEVRYHSMTNLTCRFTARSKEWQKVIGSSTNLAEMCWVMTNEPSDFQLVQQFNETALDPLPSWSFDHTGVDVDMLDPEVSDPDFKKDYRQARNFKAKIVMLLKPYRSN